MAQPMDINSISVDIDNSPTMEIQSPVEPIRTETTDYSEILRRLAGIQAASVPCFTIYITLDFLFTMMTLVVGSANIHACPLEPMIPTYLVVSSVFNLLSIVLSAVACTFHLRGKDKDLMGFFFVIFASIAIIIIQIFRFIWLILGTMWVFKNFNQVDYNPFDEQSKYCQAGLYQYAMLAIILQYITPLISCCCKNFPLRKQT